MNQSKKSLGKVYLVGAGPGDPGLLTVKGKTLLELADVVLYDALVSDQILNLINIKLTLLAVFYIFGSVANRNAITKLNITRGNLLDF